MTVFRSLPSVATALSLTLALAGCGGGQATVGGNVTGLTSGLSVVLQNNGADNLTVTGTSAMSVSFAFPTDILASSAYSVSVFTQPPGENCVVSNGSGTMAASALDVTNVAVACTVTATVVAVVSGLASNSSVTLSSSGSTMVTGNGNFAFPGLLAQGATYSVVITKQPTGQICSLSGASGTVVANQNAVVPRDMRVSGRAPLPRARLGNALTMAGVYFLLLLDSSILNTSLPKVADSMGVQPLAVSPTITGYLLASVASMPLSGWLSMRFGARRVYLAAIVVFTLASLACGLSVNLLQLVLSRIVQGAAGGLMLTVGRAVALRGAEKSELLRVTSLLTWPALMAPIVGPPLGGWITTYLSWRWNFLLNVPIGIVGAWCVAAFVSRDGATERAPLDVRGALLTVVGLAGLFGGLEALAQAPERGEGAWIPAAIAIAIGAVVLVLAVRHLNRVERPLVSLAPLRVQTFSVTSFQGGTWSVMCLQATPFLLPLLFQLALGYSAAAAGAMLLPYFIGNLGIKFFSTPLLRLIGFRQLLMVDGALAMVCIGLFGFVGQATPLSVMVVLLLVAGATRSLLFTGINNLCYADVDEELRPAASTLSSVASLLGQSLGIVVSTLLLAGAMAWDGHSSPGAVDFQVAFFGVALIGLASTVAYGRLSPRAGEELSGHRATRLAPGAVK